jgi:hypothetical protein
MNPTNVIFIKTNDGQQPCDKQNSVPRDDVVFGLTKETGTEEQRSLSSYVPWATTCVTNTYHENG